MDQAQINRDHYRRKAAEIRKRGAVPATPVCCCPCHEPKPRGHWAPPPVANKGMPDPKVDRPAYQRERARRIRNGTWITSLSQAAARRAVNNKEVQ